VRPCRDPGYAGIKDREIKAPSPQQVQQHQAGPGMGCAMPAELSRFTGTLFSPRMARLVAELLRCAAWAAARPILVKSRTRPWPK